MFRRHIEGDLDWALAAGHRPVGAFRGSGPEHIGCGGQSDRLSAAALLRHPPEVACVRRQTPARRASGDALRPPTRVHINPPDFDDPQAACAPGDTVDAGIGCSVRPTGRPEEYR